LGLHDYTVYDFICRNAALYPERDCLVFNDLRLTHVEYKERCDRLASGLVQSGIEVGDRLAVVAENSDEFMILYGAAAKIGAIVLAVNWRFKQDEVEYVLNDCTPRMMFAGPEYREMVAAAARNIESIEKCFTLSGGQASEGFLSFADLYQEEKKMDIPDIPADSGYVIIHTAAVSGHPRGALLSQGNVVASNMTNIAQFTLGMDDCHVCMLPLFHYAGLSYSMAVMHAGGKNVILERFDPEIVLEMVASEKVTIFMQFPPMLKAMIDKYAERSFDLSSLRIAGGIDQPDNLSAFQNIAPNVRYWTGFGQTESGVVTSGFVDERPGSAGKPGPLARVALFDDYDREVAPGTSGEICVRSPMVFLGYWGLEEDTAYTFRNGWHHTGDVGRFDEKGYLHYVKRKVEKELIKPGGENVYPAEVEKVILSHQAVAEVSVIGVRDPQWGEAVKAICVLQPGESLEPDELIEFVASKIARYKKPKQVVFVEALPKNDEGEIDRNKVKAEHGGRE
jgi:long-chain acyl-CoA synthetase